MATARRAVALMASPVVKPISFGTSAPQLRMSHTDCMPNSQKSMMMVMMARVNSGKRKT